MPACLIASEEIRHAAVLGHGQGCPYGPIGLGSVLSQVQRSGATYFAVSVAHGGSGSGPNGDYAKVSGGRIDRVQTDSAIPDAMARIASDLHGQCAVTYDASPVPRQGVRLLVEVKRPGVTVHAPERVGVR